MQKTPEGTGCCRKCRILKSLFTQVSFGVKGEVNWYYLIINAYTCLLMKNFTVLLITILAFSCKQPTLNFEQRERWLNSKLYHTHIRYYNDSLYLTTVFQPNKASYSSTVFITVLPITKIKEIKVLPYWLKITSIDSSRVFKGMKFVNDELTMLEYANTSTQMLSDMSNSSDTCAKFHEYLMGIINANAPYAQ